ncbi:helix-turn-helix domain-containing protein [Kitasatospora purpeofusca]|uniref:helix-turn-helix domain-containing protein n=1 Tax=Kitasatospora purpeofusca TaxID=67352 RepID=UPI00387096D4|nr:helix-turn-helix transcriptional regulator [Kitasatospora purpeofusca]
MGDNAVLRRRLVELGLSHAELAHRVNRHIEKVTGRYGSCSQRTVRDWLSGRTSWPHQRQRASLEAVFDCTAEELGFTPRAAKRPAPQPEEDLRRRTFIASGPAAAAASGFPSSNTRTMLGASDVLRLRAGLETLHALDDNQGGHAALERTALARAEQVLTALRTSSATERVRRRLFSIASDFTAMASWSCIDARALDDAQRHLDTCMRLAGLAQDSSAQFKAWNLIAMLSNQRGRHADAVAAAHAARATGITRRDPMFSSLAHARAAVGHSNVGERQAAVRSLGLANEALSRIRQESRPSWMAFYGPAELYALTALVHDRLGENEQAEGASHQALAMLPSQFRRNRSLITARLALAQLRQGDLELAAATASTIFELMDGAPLPGRLRTLLGDFHRGLLTTSENSRAAREWGDRYRTEWSRR